MKPGFLFLAILAVVAIPALLLVNARQSNGLPGAGVVECPTEVPDLSTATAALTLTAAATTTPEPTPPPDTATAPPPLATATSLAQTSTPEPPAPTATPLPPLSSLSELQSRMEAAVNDYWVPGNYAVAVSDLQTGETVGVNASRPQLGACTMNFFVLLLVTMDLQDGRYPVDEVDTLMSETTWSSNAQTARELYRIAGAGDVIEGVRRVDALMRDTVGLSSGLNHPPLYREEAIGPLQDNYLTAYEANQALAQLWSGSLLTPDWQAYLLAKLEAVKPGLNYLLGIAPGTVSHKNGFFEGTTGFVDNDIGIIRLQTAGGEVAFAMSFFSEEVQTKYADITLGQQLVQLAVAHFRSAYN